MRHSLQTPSIRHTGMLKLTGAQCICVAGQLEGLKGPIMCDTTRQVLSVEQIQCWRYLIYCFGYALPTCILWSTVASEAVARSPPRCEVGLCDLWDVGLQQRGRLPLKVWHGGYQAAPQPQQIVYAVRRPLPRVERLHCQLCHQLDPFVIFLHMHLPSQQRN